MIILISYQLSKKYKKILLDSLLKNVLRTRDALYDSGINIKKKNDKDQNYRTVDEVDTDILIVGRGIYQNDDYVKECQKYSIL